jgi:hypothetical protein
VKPSKVAASIACPRCHQQIGLGCRDERGRPCALHAERLARARALGLGAKPKRRRRKGAPRRPSTSPPPAPVVIKRLDGTIVSIVSQRSLRTKKRSG